MKISEDKGLESILINRIIKTLQQLEISYNYKNNKLLVDNRFYFDLENKTYIDYFENQAEAVPFDINKIMFIIRGNELIFGDFCEFRIEREDKVLCFYGFLESFENGVYWLRHKPFGSETSYTSFFSHCKKITEIPKFKEIIR